MKGVENSPSKRMRRASHAKQPLADQTAEQPSLAGG